MGLPDHIINKIADPAERVKHTTWLEALTRDHLKLERQLHVQFSGFLYRHTFKKVIHCDPTRKATIRPGWPDYSLFGQAPLALFIEFKISPNKLSPEQLEVRHELESAGWLYLVAYDYETAVSVTRATFHLP